MAPLQGFQRMAVAEFGKLLGVATGCPGDQRRMFMFDAYQPLLQSGVCERKTYASLNICSHRCHINATTRYVEK
jgi:hypothetical protein